VCFAILVIGKILDAESGPLSRSLKKVRRTSPT